MPGKNRWQPKKYPSQFYSEVSKRGLAYALKSFARAPALLAKRSNPQDCYFRSCCVDYYRPAGLIAQAQRITLWALYKSANYPSALNSKVQLQVETHFVRVGIT